MRLYYTGTNDYETAHITLGFDFAGVGSSALPVHGLLPGLECFLVSGNASISHLYSTSQYVRRGVTKIGRSLDYS